MKMLDNWRPHEKRRMTEDTFIKVSQQLSDSSRTIVFQFQGKTAENYDGLEPKRSGRIKINKGGKRVLENGRHNELLFGWHKGKCLCWIEEKPGWNGAGLAANDCEL